jgi:hypothetical protein
MGRRCSACVSGELTRVLDTVAQVVPATAKNVRGLAQMKAYEAQFIVRERRWCSRGGRCSGILVLQVESFLKLTRGVCSPQTSLSCLWSRYLRKIDGRRQTPKPIHFSLKRRADFA